jgi:hypothetical protein
MSNLFQHFKGWAGSSPSKAAVDQQPDRAQSEEHTATPRSLKRKADPYDFEAQGK